MKYPIHPTTYVRQDICVMCEKKYFRTYKSLRKTCSKECSTILRSKNTAKTMSCQKMKEKIFRKLRGRKHTLEARKNMSRGQLGNKNNLGKRLSKETRTKISIANKGRVITRSARKNMSVAKIGNSNRVGTDTSIEGRKNMSIAAARARVDGRKRYVEKYKGNKMSSTWEVLFAKWLDDKGMSWKYEPTYFETSEGCYVPDFYVEGIGYVEVSGFRKKIAKIDAFINEFSEEIFFVNNINNIEFARWVQ